ncbi:MAG: hypothetical protein KDB65_12690 [Calditrichaeota bacterium]|nr:hypothetical protein [Calditrichota bacterium]MCB9368189.1 hypothetical protein [Calditrichota bacterium]
MDGKRGIGNWRGWRKLVWLVVAAVCCIAGIIVFFPNSIVNQQLAASLTNYMVTKLGPEAICGSVDLGWKHLSLEDVMLPIDDHGSVLSISRIEATVDPLIALSQPREYTRIIRSLNVVNPELKLIVAKRENSDPDTATKPLVPDVIFGVLSRVDSLRSITLENGKLRVLGTDTTYAKVDDIFGVLANQGDGFNIRLRGRGDLPIGMELQVNGDIKTSARTLDLSATVEFAQSCVTVDSTVPATVSLESGKARITLRQSDGLSSIDGVADLQGANVQVASNSVSIPSAEIVLSNNVLAWDSMDVLAPGVVAVTSGKVDIQDSLRLSGVLQGNIGLKEFFRSLSISDSGLQGSVEFTAAISGTAKAPIVEASAVSENADVLGVKVDHLKADVRFDSGTLSLNNVEVANENVDASVNGELWLKGSREVSLNGLLRPKAVPELLGQAFGVRELAFAVEGAASSPSLSWVARDSVGELLGNGSAAVEANSWTLSFADPSGKTGVVTISVDSSEWHVSASNAHIVVPVAYPTSSNALKSVTSLEFEFVGNDSSGTSHLSVGGDTLGNSVLTQVLRQLQFDGSYARDAVGAYNLNGRWVGLSGEGEEFFGQGKVTIHDDLLTVDNLYFDEAGSVEGSVRIDSPLVNLKISVEQLPLSKTPFVAKTTNDWKLDGVISGEMTLVGPKDSLQWQIDLSLVDGVAQGVPGYWGLVAAKGTGERVDSVSSSFGRGVRSIFELAGSLDFGMNAVDMRLNFPASECADFIQALSGRTGLLSGNLDGEVLVFGKLSAPDVVASMRVSHGELLGELAVDRFAIDAALATERNGKRLLTVPQLSFYKEDKYKFYGELSAEPRSGGDFRGYLEGSGDFLDLIQQVDADFTSQGSQSTLRAEVGGTWDKPQFEGTELTISDGKFTYPPATPGLLFMNTTLRLNSEGVVDTGRIQVNAGSEFLRVDLVGTDDRRAGMLSPLTIPGPGIQLGIIVLSTSENGLPVRLPGFMKPEWLGRMTTGAGGFSPITISAFDSTRLRIGGEAQIRDARFTFPFISYGGGQMRPVTKWLVDRLYETWWNLDVSMGSGSHYDVEITGFKDSELYSRLGGNFIVGTVAEYLDHISVDAIVSPTERPLVMEGSLVDSTMRLSGKLGSASGKADYLDQTFWIEKLQAEFDETDIFPIISGRSATYGIDSVGRTVPVYLTIYEIDEETNTRVPYGRFEDVTYVLEADGYPDQEQVLGLLGYDLTNMSQGKAEQLLTRTALTAAKRVWLDPISRKLERATFFDEISLAPGGGASASIFRQQRESVLRDTLESNTAVKFLTGSNVTVGKYFGRDVFLTYTGELAEAAGEVEGGRLGLIHYWNLQYRVAPVSPDFVLDFAVEYDEASRKRDESVALKYSFVLEP